jgi:hypothetical protein
MVGAAIPSIAAMVRIVARRITFAIRPLGNANAIRSTHAAMSNAATV